MKKESKNYKARYSRFILLAIFTLLVADTTFAQCVDTWNLSGSCSTAIQMDKNIDVSKGPCYNTVTTDLAVTDAPKLNSTISIGSNSALFTLSVGNIRVLSHPTPTSCLSLDGTYNDGTPKSVSQFETNYGIRFTPNKNNMDITKTKVVTVFNMINLVGKLIYFEITASHEGSTPITRNYFFTMTGDSYILGDPHITTVEGVTYDFQSVGEFVALRDNGGSFEIQTRQTAVSTNGPGSASNNTAGLTTCVSVNTAVAARVGTHRISYEPISGAPDPKNLQLKVDGTTTTIGANGIDLGSGGRIVNSSAGPGVIEIDFPNGTALTVAPWHWDAYNQWLLNLSISNTVATKGLMGVIPDSSWLPSLPDGRPLRSKPTDPGARFDTVYKTFADAWRVTDSTSLFDYATGTSTATFTNKNWPAKNAESCLIVPGPSPLPAITLQVAQQLTIGIVDPNMRADAILDVMVTGDSGFVKSYLLTQRTMTGSTATRLLVSKDTTNSGDSVAFKAIVSRQFSAAKDSLAGSVEFTADGDKIGEVKLVAGLAVLTTTSLKAGQHQIAAKFIPSDSTAFSSSSLDRIHIVIGGSGSSILHQWWFWLIVLLIILGIIIALRRKKKIP